MRRLSMKKENGLLSVKKTRKIIEDAKVLILGEQKN